MNCKHCGAELPVNANYCIYCNAPVDKSGEQGSQPANNNTGGGHRQPDQGTSGYSQTGGSGYIPPGFTFDPNRGMYFKVEDRFSPQANQNVRETIYYNPQTRQYSSYSQPIYGGQPGGGYRPPIMPPQPQKRVWPVVLVVALVIIVLVGFLGFLGVMMADRDSIYSRYDYGYGNNNDYYNDYDDNNPFSSFYDDSDNLETFEKELSPLFEPSNNKYKPDFQTDSIYENNAIEDDTHVYFVSYTNRAENGYRYDYLYRMNKDTKAIEIVVDARDLGGIYTFDLTDDSVVFSILGDEYETRTYMATYYKVAKSGGNAEQIFNAMSGAFSIYEGYVYLLNSGDARLIKIGYDNDQNIKFDEYVFDVVGYDDIVTSRRVSIVDDLFTLRVFNKANQRESFYQYDINSLIRVEVFRGTKGFTYHDMFIDNKNIYYAKYDFFSEQGNDVEIASSTLGELESEEDIYTYEIDYWPNYGILVGKNGDNIVYETNGSITVADINEPKTALNTIELNKDEKPYAMTKNWIITNEKIIDLEDYTQTQIKDIKETPLVKGIEEHAYSYNFDNDSGGSSSRFSPFQYSTDTQGVSMNVAEMVTSAGYIAGCLPENMSGNIDESVAYLYSREWVENPLIKNMVVDENGKVDVDLMRSLMYDVFVCDYETVPTLIKNGDIKGFITEDNGEVFLDPDWVADKPVAEVEILNNDYDVASGDGNANIKVHYNDGSTEEYYVDYYEDDYSIFNEYTILGLYK